ncbi:hypothetical protein VUR80DRAFT_9199 [Thermomyces stellatus]
MPYGRPAMDMSELACHAARVQERRRRAATLRERELRQEELPGYDEEGERGVAKARNQTPRCFPFYITVPGIPGYHLGPDDLDLPLTVHPDNDPKVQKALRTANRAFIEVERALYNVRCDIFRKLWAAIGENDADRLEQMIAKDGLISPDALNYSGRSPIVTAVSCGHIAIVRKLKDLGADVNQFATAGWDDQQRTALQVAASKGNLPIVRCLMEECGADDALIAPDGQLALRLAADAGHREIVAYLPARRGGGWRRFKAHHSVAMRRARKAGKNIAKFSFVVFCELPYRVLLYAPYKVGQFAWRHRAGIAGMIAVIIVRSPVIAFRAVTRLPLMIADLARWLWKVAKKSPEKIRRVGQIVGRWLAGAVRGLGVAVAEVFRRLFSVLHTVVTAMFRLVKDLTFRDVWNGFCMLVRAVFVNLPKAVARGIQGLAEASYEVLKAVLGIFGKVAWWILRILAGVIMFIPSQIARIAEACGKSIAKGFREIMVWTNPKKL